MIDETNPRTGQGQEQNPIERTRRAPGSEQEYQGNQPQEKRAPGVEQDDSTEDEGHGKRKSA